MCSSVAEDTAKPVCCVSLCTCKIGETLVNSQPCRLCTSSHLLHGLCARQYCNLPKQLHWEAKVQMMQMHFSCTSCQVHILLSITQLWLQAERVAFEECQLVVFSLMQTIPDLMGDATAIWPQLLASCLLFMTALRKKQRLDDQVCECLH